MVDAAFGCRAGARLVVLLFAAVEVGFVFITANAPAVLGLAMFAEMKLRPGTQWCNGNLPDKVRVK